MTAIDQTPDTNSESRRLADNHLPPAVEVFRASEQKIYRRADGISIWLKPRRYWMASVKRSLDRCANWNDSPTQATLPGAHALLTDIRQKVPRVRSAFTQPVQTLPTSNS